MTEPNHKAVAVIERGALPERVHPVVAQAMQHNPDPETLGKLLDLQERWEKGEARKVYTAALVGLKRDLPTVIAKDKTVDFQGKTRVRYTYASLAQVMTEVTEPLTQHGFSIAWVPRTEQGKVSVTCRLTHSAGHSEETTIDAPIDNSGSKSPAQGVASTITLLSRYTCLALLGIATADMEDPEGEMPPDLVDTKKNMRAVKFVVDNGYTKKQAEELIGKPVQVWTSADLGKLKERLKEIGAKKRKAKGKKASPAEKPTKTEEPAHDPDTGEVIEGSLCAQPNCDSPATHGIYCGGHLPSQKGQGQLDMREPGGEG